MGILAIKRSNSNTITYVSRYMIRYRSIASSQGFSNKCTGKRGFGLNADVFLGF